MSPLECAAVVFGLACVYLTIRQSILCWPTGLVQVLLYIVIFYEVKLYSDMLLQIVYVVLQIYGWNHWLHGGASRHELPVSRLSSKAFFLWILMLIPSTALLGYLMATKTDAALPYPDAFATVASLVAQWLLARKRLESWLVWIVVDVVSIIIYAMKGLFLTSGLYAVFLVMAAAGFIAWRRAMDQTTSLV